MSRFFPLRVLLMLVFAFLPLSKAAAANADRFQFNHDIQVQPDERVGDVTCLNCSIYVRGQVSGDVTVINGNIVGEQGSMVGGDIIAIHGNVRAESGSQVEGDLTAIAGTARRDPQATVGGDVTSMGGGGWVLLIFLVPFAILGGIVALIIWLIQRSRRPAQVPAYTLHRN